MKHLNPIKLFRIDIFENNILKRSERLLVEDYINLGECAKSVRKRLKRLKSNGLKTITYYVRQSSSVELLNTLKK